MFFFIFQNDDTKKSQWISVPKVEVPCEKERTQQKRRIFNSSSSFSRSSRHFDSRVVWWMYNMVWPRCLGERLPRCLLETPVVWRSRPNNTAIDRAPQRIVHYYHRLRSPTCRPLIQRRLSNERIRRSAFREGPPNARRPANVTGESREI